MPLYTVKVEGADELIAALRTPLEQISAIRGVVRKFAREAQREATMNVSGRQVSFEGGSFIINRQTGNLARSIQIVDVSALSATIVATGGGERGEDYAAAVETGHKAFDLKPFLMGKTVPLPVTKGTPGAVMVPNVATTGRQMGNKFILFRRVGPNSKGWIIPAAPPRPFMAAAAATIAGPFNEAILEALRENIEGAGPHASS